MASMRPLTLHASALSDCEYDLYTSSLSDLCVTSDAIARDDPHFETTTVGVREARAWIRGRYHGLPASDIDDILRLFSPSLMPSDTLTGGQFFAALRLVVHAQSGKGVDRSLAFVQAQPGTTKPTGISRPPSPPKRSVIAPPSHPDRSKGIPFSTSPPETNPFVRRSTEHASSVQSVLRTSSDGQTSQPSQQSSQKISHNPFLVRDRVESPDAIVKSSERAPAKGGKLPPLPPRKLTTSASAQQPSEVTTAPPAPLSPPLVLPKPSHVMSPLMRQSLEASKHGQTMRQRVQVLKSTSGTSRTRSASDTEDTPTPSSTPSSASSSLASLDQVASATLKPPLLSPSIVPPPLPNRESVISGLVPAPPTHPDRRPSTATDDSQQPASARVFRSKSMHHSDSPPVPPPRRKRPESVQFMPPSGTTDGPSSPRIPIYSHGHSRNSSIKAFRTASLLHGVVTPRTHRPYTRRKRGLVSEALSTTRNSGSGMRWLQRRRGGMMADTQGATPATDQGPRRETWTMAEGSRRRFLGEADNLKLPPEKIVLLDIERTQPRTSTSSSFWLVVTRSNTLRGVEEAVDEQDR
ncbi:hypothetical protein EDC04DRAFT_2820473 [Pisolithus marmoratus]|nr:hypothetical protein EDC04DRAFT_2820473 [Pisolithus marmoratus]